MISRLTRRLAVGGELAQAPALREPVPQQPAERHAEGEGQRGEARRDGEGDDEVRSQDGQPRRHFEQQVRGVLDALDLGREERMEIGGAPAAQPGPRGAGDGGIGADPQRHGEVEGEFGPGDLPGAGDQGAQHHDHQEQQQQERQRARQQGEPAARVAGIGGAQRIQQGHEQGKADAVGGAGQHDQQGQEGETPAPGLPAAQAPGRSQVIQHLDQPAGAGNESMPQRIREIGPAPAFYSAAAAAKRRSGRGCERSTGAPASNALSSGMTVLANIAMFRAASSCGMPA